MTVSVGVLFPGQGSQFVGMGADLFGPRPDLLGAPANEVLGFDLESVCLDGPEEDLLRTEHAQPALFAISYALYDELSTSTGLAPAGMAGHSLGEYTALAAAGALDYLDALRVVAARSRAMSAAADRQPSGMAALIGADRARAEEVCEARRALGGRLQVANVNSPAQVVVAGGAEDIDWLVESSGEYGIRRAIPLKVAGGFHSSFMASAAASLADALSEVTILEPKVPVWSNTTAQPHEASAIAAVLARQVVEPVLFADLLEDMSSSGVDLFVHVGPGDVTAGLVRKTLPQAETLVVSGIKDIPAASEALGTMRRR